MSNEHQRNYWNDRYRADPQIWGESPSPTLATAMDYFRRFHCSRIAVPGCGYGRHLHALCAADFAELSAMDLSDEAVKLAAARVPRAKVEQANFLNWAPSGAPFDGIYIFNLLHFFMEEARSTFSRRLHSLLSPDGIAVITVFSTAEAGFGRGKEVEAGSWESKAGRPAHYFRAEELRGLFRGFRFLELRLVAEAEDHGHEGPHEHQLLLAVMQRDSAVAAS